MVEKPVEASRSVRVRIEGIVQGVGFRYWVKVTADGLALDGWVRNRRDASVEALFRGPATRVNDMLDRCRDGPASARVAAVTILAEDESAPPGFEMRPTV
jgi:acylphosphatase